MDKIQELFVVLDDKPGALGVLCRILKKKRISIHAIGLFGDTARLYVSHPDKANDVLVENGYAVETCDVLRVVLPNKQGALMDLAMKLGNAGVNITYMYGALEKKQRRGSIILEVDKPDLALGIFKNHRF